MCCVIYNFCFDYSTVVLAMCLDKLLVCILYYDRLLLCSVIFVLQTGANVHNETSSNLTVTCIGAVDLTSVPLRVVL